MITVIPAIDIIGGKCVRLSEGDYSRVSEYSANPLEVAKQFEDAGVRRLHLVDLDGAKNGASSNMNVLEKIAGATQIEVDFGGGITSMSILEDVLSAGAKYVTIGSMAAKNPDIFEGWITRYGSERFFVGADVRNTKIAVKGWLEQTEIDVFDFLRSMMNKGVHYVFCTDISKDGMLQGPSLDLYRDIIERMPGIRLVASGGVSSVADIEMLDAVGCESVIVGKAFYEGKITMKDLSRFQNP